jgi:hypothetical protein
MPKLLRFLLLVALLLGALLPGVCQAQEGPLQVESRRRVAAADLRLASQWLAYAYQIPSRVPQEMLLAGYGYGNTLVALALVGRGASLNEVLELRQRHLWPDVARQVEVDVDRLPGAIRDLMSSGIDQPAPGSLHFLPDVRPGLSERLRLPAFSPTIPDPVAVERFGLRPEEVENIRRVLDNPNEIPEEWLRLPAGRTLLTADWLIAATLAKFKPFPLETLLETRLGQVIEWGDVTSLFGMSPQVLTQGPLAAVYPALTGVPPHTVLSAHRRTRFPDQLPLRYDLERLPTTQKTALRPLLGWTYQETPGERARLDAAGLELAEKAIALALARSSGLELAVVLERRAEGDSWAGIVQRFAIDMTGQEDLWAAIQAREAR